MSVCCETSKNALKMKSNAPMTPGQVSSCHFRLLTDVYAIRSKRMLHALEAHLVHGKKRREACEMSGATQSYFSVKVRELQRVHQKITEMYAKCYPAMLDNDKQRNNH